MVMLSSQKLAEIQRSHESLRLSHAEKEAAVKQLEAELDETQREHDNAMLNLIEQARKANSEKPVQESLLRERIGALEKELAAANEDRYAGEGSGASELPAGGSGGVTWKQAFKDIQVLYRDARDELLVAQEVLDKHHLLKEENELVAKSLESLKSEHKDLIELHRSKVEEHNSALIRNRDFERQHHTMEEQLRRMAARLRRAEERHAALSSEAREELELQAMNRAKEDGIAARYQEEIAKLKRDLAVATSEITVLQTNVRSLEDNVDSAHAEAARWEALVKVAGEKEGALKDRISALKAEVNRLLVSGKREEDLRLEAEDSLGKLALTNDAMAATLEELQDSHLADRAGKKELESAHTKLQLEHGQLRINLKEAESAVAGIRQALETRQEEHKLLQESHVQLLKDHKGLKVTHNKLSEDHLHATTQLFDARRKLNDVEKKREEEKKVFHEEISQVQVQMQQPRHARQTSDHTHRLGRRIFTTSLAKSTIDRTVTDEQPLAQRFPRHPVVNEFTGLVEP